MTSAQSLNSLLVLTQIRGLCDILKIDELELAVYRLYDAVVAGRAVPEEFDSPDYHQMKGLLTTPGQSIRSIRRALWAFTNIYEDMDALSARVSQYNWDKLKTWRDANV